MGKNLKGKELGIGISQRKDGLYTGRVTDKTGKRRQKYFKKLQECRQWVADAQFQIDHGTINVLGDMTVDTWFDYWIDNIKGNAVKKNTIQSYITSYNNHISPFIGRMFLSEVKSLHCQNIMNILNEKGKSQGTQKAVRQHLHTIFQDAVENDIIRKNPVNARKVVIIKPKTPQKEKIFFLTTEQQKRFKEYVDSYAASDVYLFVLQTGLRMSEVRGLKWEDIDFDKGILHVTHNTQWDNDCHDFVDYSTKTDSSFRTVPLTQDAMRIIHSIKKERKIIDMQYKDYVFLNTAGHLHSKAYLDYCLRNYLAPKVGVDRLTMHMLRHTFATRCIESGMKPKTLQKILGHSDISMTMNLYVHCTDDYKTEEMSRFEEMMRRVM